MTTSDKNAKAVKNVCVAVRVRPMNDNETFEKARCAVTANIRKRTIAIVDRGINKEFGPFDKVYGPRAKQLEIYCDLVEPLVRNVLAGYNCTLFAYGQTSTGKTFTMEGEQIISRADHVWNEDSAVGIIPRALQHIFTELENQNAEEFSVRVSYVELYNEELYDLLGSTDVEHARLRLFEDSVRKGSVIISGLEEVPVVSRLELHELLKRGAEKRRTAATQMNLNSSRSHTVFTITVVIRENSVNGEVIKQGKLSLIDLAGSENIGRSGSIDKRAREAGSINQSLLTLGRVIMSLTSGAGHVPYRESKLTRILQDSLGGKTITTIVATLSPASTNVEESISTMEYASSAKNIKNQPEINQKLSQRALMKAYNEEMNRLMRDLQAARDKTGFFIDRQNYEDMSTQLIQQNQQIEALTDELQSVLERVQLLMQDAEIMGQHYGQLYDRYKHMEEKYKKRCDENAQLRLELADCKSDLEIHQDALENVQKLAKQSQMENEELRERCSNLESELNKVHDKVDAFQTAANKNEVLYVRCAEGHNESTDKLKKSVCRWNDTLQTDLKTIVDYCERLKLDMGKDRGEFQNCIKSLRSQLTIFFTTSTSDTNTSFVDFLRDVDLFVNEAEDYQSKAYTHCITFSNFLVSHITDYEQLSGKICAACNTYSDRLKYLSMEMKRMIVGDLEDYLKKIEEETSQSTEKFELLKNQQQSALQIQRNRGDALVVEMKSEKAAWDSLRDSFRTKITEQNGIITETNQTTGALCRDLENVGEAMFAGINETTNLNASIAESQMEQSKEASSSLLAKVDETDSDVNHFIGSIIRPSNTGDTPKRMKQKPLPDPVEIPDIFELINKSKERDAPRRLSHYRPRDSIYEAPFTVLSPKALKQTLNCELDAINESKSETEDGVEKQCDAAANITRRRVFQSRNT